MVGSVRNHVRRICWIGGLVRDEEVEPSTSSVTCVREPSCIVGGVVSLRRLGHGEGLEFSAPSIVPAEVPSCLVGDIVLLECSISHLILSSAR